MNRLLAILLISLALLANGCGDPAPSAEPRTDGTGVVRGQVTAPVAGIYLYVYKPGMDLYGPAFAVSEATSPDGRYELQLPDGDYVVVARKRQGGEATGPVTAGDNRSDFVPISLQGGVVEQDLSAPVKVGDQRSFTSDAEQSRTGIVGRVLDSDGQPLEGARVHVYDHVQMSERPKFVSEKTGPDGTYRVMLPAGGTYYLAARDKFGGPPKL
ncbi:MAG: carboxypeptidase-like regulatory domain-containing protein, partial [Candidatus Competibacterales bacterium]|nr:carboxypeptidase-like regulatory domain-containing protein [Candidatus Competibacterales bacterium]